MSAWVSVEDPSPSLSAWIVLAMVAMVAVPAAITLHTVNPPRTQPPGRGVRVYLVIAEMRIDVMKAVLARFALILGGRVSYRYFFRFFVIFSQTEIVLPEIVRIAGDARLFFQFSLLSFF